MKVAALFGSLALSGGNIALLEHLSGLRNRGFSVTIVVEDRPEQIPTYHTALEHSPIRTPAELTHERFDVAIGSWWATMLNIWKIDAEFYLNFVQSIESRFFPETAVAQRRLVEFTYSYALPVITEARWIADDLATRFGRRSQQVRNGIRKDLFYRDGPAIAPRPADGLRVLVEGSLEAPFKKVAHTIELCRKAGVGEIWLLTPNYNGNAVEGVDRIFGGLPLEEVASVYRSCDVLVKLSTVEGMFGPPLEMFHCGGTAIVHPVTGADEYIRAEENSIVVPFDDDEGVIAALRELAADRSKLRTLIAGAAYTASAWPSSDDTASGFAAALYFFRDLRRNNRLEFETRETLRKKAEFALGWWAEHTEVEKRFSELGAESNRLFGELHALDQKWRATRIEADSVHERLHVEQLAHRDTLLERDALRQEAFALNASLQEFRSPLRWPALVWRKLSNIFGSHRNEGSEIGHTGVGEAHS